MRAFGYFVYRFGFLIFICATLFSAFTSYTDVALDTFHPATHWTDYHESILYVVLSLILGVEFVGLVMYKWVGRQVLKVEA